ncbi:hypothetical protein DOK57_00225 [Campylobacter coli]|nr:hypothetical protein [Campylobacter coli]
MFFDFNNKSLSLTPQSFSNTDLNTGSPLGVCFPYEVKPLPEDTFVVSSIIDHHNGNKVLKNTETRYVEYVKNKYNEELNYYRIPTIGIALDTTKTQNMVGLCKDSSYYQSEDLGEVDINRLKPFNDIYKDFETYVFVDESKVTIKQSYYYDYDYYGNKSFYVGTTNSTKKNNHWYDVWYGTSNKKEQDRERREYLIELRELLETQLLPLDIDSIKNITESKDLVTDLHELINDEYDEFGWCIDYYKITHNDLKIIMKGIYEQKRKQLSNTRHRK